MSRWFFRHDIRLLPYDNMPSMVLSDNLRSAVAARIKSHEHGFYNHFMWAHRLGYFATQDMIYREVPVARFLKTHRLKFWVNPDWTVEQKSRIREAINKDLELPWWKRLYDPLQIFSMAVANYTKIPIDKILHIPGLKICSDRGDYLKLVDPEYSLSHPSPSDINRWLEGNPRYKVLGRYTPD